ncbi:MAG: hypothetical protein IKU25_02950 [Clostridia bacterium]|nr:hypothetical protein [Clostridia bacterium]
MWKYVETDAWGFISLHDCFADSIQKDGDDLIINFPDGFWVCPNSKYIDGKDHLRTGPAQVCFKNFVDIMDPIYIYKDMRLFGKLLLSRRIWLEEEQFMNMINGGKYTLEFLEEYHQPMNVKYKCEVFNKKKGRYTNMECEFDVFAKSIEYRWNEITCREW